MCGGRTGLPQIQNSVEWARAAEADEALGLALAPSENEALIPKEIVVDGDAEAG